MGPVEVLLSALSAGATVIGVVVWAVRIEGRVNGHDRELNDVKDDVRYIRTRIDQAIEARR
jgi:hypothetical protein